MSRPMGGLCNGVYMCISRRHDCSPHSHTYDNTHITYVYDMCVVLRVASLRVYAKEARDRERLIGPSIGYVHAPSRLPLRLRSCSPCHLATTISRSP
jgi:hypothetical protein